MALVFDVNSKVKASIFLKQDSNDKQPLRNSNLNLAKTGLILLTVPLVFQIVLSLQLSDALWQIERQTLARLRSTAIIAAASQINMEFFSIATLLSLFRYTKDSSIADGYRQSKQAAIDSSNYLLQLTRDNPEQHARAQKVSKLGNIATAAIGEFERPMEMGQSSILEATRFRRELNQILVPMISELDAIVKQERLRLTGNQPDFDRLFKITIIGFLANLLLSGLLALFFSNSVVSRIVRLIDNLKLCAERRELPPMLKGKDEFAKLDIAFHQLDSRLTDIENRKREFVAMVNHDLRTPLTALQYVLALAMRGSYGEFNDDEKKIFQDQENKLIELVDYVNEFLDDEKKKSLQIPGSEVERQEKL